MPSRFVDEIPADILEREDADRVPESRHRFGGAQAWRHSGGRAITDDNEPDGETSAPWRVTRARPHVRARSVGREVTHERFGRGVVLEAEGDGDDLRFTVRFGTTIKKVLGRFLEGGQDVD